MKCQLSFTDAKEDLIDSKFLCAISDYIRERVQRVESATTFTEDESREFSKLIELDKNRFAKIRALMFNEREPVSGDIKIACAKNDFNRFVDATRAYLCAEKPQDNLSELTIYKILRSSVYAGEACPEEYYARCGRMDLLELRLLTCPKANKDNICNILVSTKQFKNLVRAVNLYGCPMTEKTYELAARESTIEILQWIHASKCPRDANGILCRIMSRIEGFSDKGVSEADIEVVRWIDSCECPKNIRERLYNLTARAENAAGFDGTDLCIIAQQGYLTILQHLHRCGYFDASRITSEAAFGGHLAILKWIYELDLLSAGLVYEYATRGNKLDCLIWLNTVAKVDWSYVLKFVSIGNGYLQILNWIYERMVENSQQASENFNGACAFTDAFKTERIDILEWFLAHNFSVLPQTYERIMQETQKATVDWFVKNKPPVLRE